MPQVGKMLVVVALLAGCGLALQWTGRSIDVGAAAYLAVAAAIMALPALRRAASRKLSALAKVNPRVVAGGLFVLALGELAWSAVRAEQFLGPKSQDERSYVLGARIMAAGRLWEPPPPSPASFESFYIVTTPVYASVYAPGTSLFYVPGVWLGAPPWVTSLLLSAACVPAAYLMLRQVPEDEGAGAALAPFGALLVLGGAQFRSLVLSPMSQVPAQLLVSLALAAALRFRRSPNAWAGLATGAFAAWAFAVRPQDGAWLGLAVIALLLPRWREGARGWPAVLAGAAPFLALVLLHDYGTTGSPFRMPHLQYINSMLPGIGFGPPPPGIGVPATALQQKIDCGVSMVVQARDAAKDGLLADDLSRRLPASLAAAIPLRLLVVLVPLGLVGLAIGSRGRALLVGLAGAAAVYGTYNLYLSHYPVPATPVLIATLLGAAIATRRFAPPLVAANAQLGIALAVLAGALGNVPLANPGLAVPRVALHELPRIDAVERGLATRPAVVFYRYRSPDAQHLDFCHEEPVYNLGAARVQDNAVIRAHDLGREANERLLRELGADGRKRYVYLYDRPTQTLYPLGWSDALARPADN